MLHDLLKCNLEPAEMQMALRWAQRMVKSHLLAHLESSHLLQNLLAQFNEDLRLREAAVDAACHAEVTGMILHLLETLRDTRISIVSLFYILTL